MATQARVACASEHTRKQTRHLPRFFPLWEVMTTNHSLVLHRDLFLSQSRPRDPFRKNSPRNTMGLHLLIRGRYHYHRPLLPHFILVNPSYHLRFQYLDDRQCRTRRSQRRHLAHRLFYTVAAEIAHHPLHPASQLISLQKSSKKVQLDEGTLMVSRKVGEK